MSNESSSGGGCGCLTIIIAILIFTALWFGLPTPWGKINIDIFPPAIWEMNAAPQAKEESK